MLAKRILALAAMIVLLYTSALAEQPVIDRINEPGPLRRMRG